MSRLGLFETKFISIKYAIQTELTTSSSNFVLSGYEGVTFMSLVIVGCYKSNDAIIVSIGRAIRYSREWKYK